MNIDDMKEEKDVSQSGVDKPEEKNADGSTTVQMEPQGSLNENAAAKEASVAEEASITKEAEQADKEILKPGAQLAAYRVAAGIEPEQVAASLKMTVRQVRELEADNYESLHGVAISRGFVRAYAKMLQIDPEPLVAMFTKEEPASKQLNQIPRQNASERFAHGSQSFGKKRKMGKAGWLILIVVVLAVVYGARTKWFSTDQKKAELAAAKKQDVSSPVSSEIETPKEVIPDSEKAPASLENTAAKDDKPIEEQAAQKSEDKPAAASEKVSLPAEKQDSLPSKAEKAPEVQPEKSVAPAVPQNLLTVRFVGPTRIRVLKADASVLHEFEGRAGDVQKMEISEPVTLVVERAGSVEAEFREQPLVLKTARRSAEARVELK